MPPPALTVVKERKLAELIAPPKGSSVLEASGVVCHGRDFYVIFDNIRRVARIHRSLAPGRGLHGWFGHRREGEGYEDIAFSPHLKRFYLLIEAEKHHDGTFKPLIDDVTNAARSGAGASVNVSVQEAQHRPRGARRPALEGEGLPPRALRREPVPRRERGAQGRRRADPCPGAKVPALGVDRVDQAAAERRLRGLLRGRTERRPHRGRVADDVAPVDRPAAPRHLDDRRRGPHLRFAADEEGKIRYCTIEGLCWLTDSTFVAVSDLVKRYHSNRCHDNDQSIHIFALPSGGARQRR